MTPPPVAGWPDGRTTQRAVTQVLHSVGHRFPDDSPRNHAARSIPAKAAFQPKLLFVALDDERVVGTTMAGYDGHRGWFYSVAVDPDLQRRGIATAMVAHVEVMLAAMGCVKVNLQIRAGNETVAAFYESLGYTAEPRVSMGKLLDASMDTSR